MNHPKKKSAATLPLVRCAIYTRKSTEEGLEQEGAVEKGRGLARRQPAAEAPRSGGAAAEAVLRPVAARAGHRAVGRQKGVEEELPTEAHARLGQRVVAGDLPGTESLGNHVEGQVGRQRVLRNALGDGTGRRPEGQQQCEGQKTSGHGESPPPAAGYVR